MMELILSSLFQQPDQSDIEIPPKEKKFRGYFKIARHYKWALNQVFVKLGYSTAIIVEGIINSYIFINTKSKQVFYITNMIHLHKVTFR